MSIVFVGNKYTSSMKRRIEKDRICEKCGHRFKHSFEINAKGQELSLYGLDDEGAKRRAASEAKKILEKSENKINPLFPCPSCGWFQSDMVLTRKKYLFSEILMIAYTVPAFCTVIAIIAGGIIYVGDGFQGVVNFLLNLWPLWITYILCTLVVLVILTIRKYSNPNRKYNQ